MLSNSQAHDRGVSIGAGLLFGAGAAALGVLSPTRPLVGTALYTVAALVAGALSSRASTAIRSPSASTANTTLTLIGVAAAVVFPALVAASGLGYFEWTPLSAGLGLAVGGLFVVYGVVGLADSIRGQAV